TNTIANTIMFNVVGEDIKYKINDILNIKGTTIHDYGKEIKPGRKVGHITIINPSNSRLMDNAHKLKTLISKKLEKVQVPPLS
ncbi:MAG: hypothetical protein ACRCXZ_05600, partial [Patescibacteria group bacterium]